MRTWGTPLRNGALIGAGILSVTAIYLFVTNQMTWLYGALIIGGGVVCAALGFGATRLSALMELMEESQQTEAEIQRKLIDALAESDQIRLDRLSESIGVPAEHIQKALHNLIDLGLFSGAVAWDSGTVYPRPMGYLRSLAACVHCDESFSVGQTVICPVCRTQYSDILTPNH